MTGSTGSPSSTTAVVGAHDCRRSADDRLRCVDAEPATMSRTLLLDVMCGGLVAHLRMCGHDAAYAGDRGLEDDDELLAVARREGRTILTRDVALAGRAGDAILLEAREPEEQLRELHHAGIELTLDDEPSRCGACNGPLERVDDDGRTPTYAPDPAVEPVWQCRDCGQAFWTGSHWDRVAETLEGIRRDGGP